MSLASYHYRSLFKIPFFQTLLIFALSLFALYGIWQIPFTYTIPLGNDDNWQVMRGFGDREQNEFFAFRWTVANQAELRIPDIGWPGRIGLVGSAPRPDNSQPTAIVAISEAKTTFVFGPEVASFPPDKYGRFTFEAGVPRSNFVLTANTLQIDSELFQPAGDPRALGIALSQVYIRPEAGKFGVLPPLALWLGFSTAIALVAYLWATWRRKPAATYVALTAGVFLIAGVCLGKLLVPQWLVENGAGISWGAILPLFSLALFSRTKLRLYISYFPVVLFGLILLAVLLLFYGIVLAPFVVSLFAVTLVFLLWRAWQSDFSSHLENIGIIFCLSAGAAWGLWQGRLPRTDDVPNYHLYWINQLDSLISQGNFYPRFAPDFNWGQGGLVFNFYGPLTRYIPEAFHLLGTTFNNGVMLLQYGTLLFGAVGCYFWSIELIRNRRGGILGGLAFCYYPYNIASTYASGAIANQLAGAMLPWLMWRITRVVRDPYKPFGWLWLGLSAAGLVMSNNAVLNVSTPIISLYLVGLLALEWRQLRVQWRQVFLKLGLGGATGVGLSAFYILPAVIESKQLSLVNVGQRSDFYANMSESFYLWKPIFPNMREYSFLGILHFVLAFAGLAMLFVLKRSKKLRLNGLWLCGLMLVSLFLQTPASRFLWDAFPLFSGIQLSSRLMTHSITFAAPLIAALALPFAVEHEKTIAVVAKPWRKIPVVGLIVATFMVYACLQNLTIAYWPYSFDGTISKKAMTEQVGNGDMIYLPKNVVEIGSIERYRAPAFSDNRVSSLGWEVTGSDSYRLTAKVSQAGTIVVPLFWLEGWWKVQDQTGQVYTPKPTPRTGLISLDVLPGDYRISLEIQDTPIKLVGNILTLGSLLAISSVILLYTSRRKRLRL